MRWVAVLVLIVLLLSLPQLAGPLLSQVLVLVGLYVLLALGLNIVVGYAGLLDLGYVAFYAVGAYLTALLTSPTSSLGWGLPFWVALPIVVVGAAVTGLLIGAPVLRLRGDYLAIVTLGFGEIARVIFLSDAFEPWFGGVQGILERWRDLRHHECHRPDPRLGAPRPDADVLPAAAVLHRGGLRRHAAEVLAHRPRVERDARGRGRRRGHRREHDELQAPGVRDGRGRRLPRRAPSSPPISSRSSPGPSTSRCRSPSSRS